MPQLSDTMDSGKILSWNKQEGDAIDRGDVLAEVETDKANLEIESFHKGVLLKIITGANDSANVGDVIAYIGEAGESIEDTSNTAPKESSNVAPEPTPAPAPEVEAAPTATPTPSHSISSTNGSSSGRIKASPLAKQMAAQKNIPLHTVTGSGPQGRIVKRDIEQLESSSPQSVTTPQPAPAAPTPQPAAARPQPTAPAMSTSPSSVPFSKMRDTIARRMQESVREAPHFYVTTSIRMDEVIRLRKKLKQRPEFERLSINHFIIKAAAYGIAQEPRVNRAVRNDTETYDPGEINIGMITAIEDGLLIPVLRQADRMSLQDVAFEANAAIERARAGRPTSADLTGGTFSISNMGMFDVENFTAIINPGQGSVLAVSSSKEQPIVENGQIIIGNMMKATISVDHRIIDGVMAGNFLKAFREALECPALMLV